MKYDYRISYHTELTSEMEVSWLALYIWRHFLNHAVGSPYMKEITSTSFVQKL